MTSALSSFQVPRIKLFLFVSLLSLPVLLRAQQHDSLNQGYITYGTKGFEFHTLDDRFLLQIQSRFQFRYATPADRDPVTLNDFTDGNAHSFRISRARLKVGGHAFKPWLSYFWEYELQQGNLLDFRVMVEPWEGFSLKAGQWKVEFNGERRISSGEQQLVDRSVINRPFTLDRQQGIELYGHLSSGGIADFNYWVAALAGTGRGNAVNDDKHFMYFGRWQWNFLGREVGFVGSDLDILERPIAMIALVGVTNRSAFTRFSQAGGGALQGYQNGASGQYRVNQFNVETAFKYAGLSWQSEVHYKEIIDKLDNDVTTVLRGYYVQAGYLLHQAISWWPAPMELAARHSMFEPDQVNDVNSGRESSVAVNYFFNEHKNKLTAEMSYFEYNDVIEDLADEWRFRLQWDISM